MTADNQEKYIREYIVAMRQHFATYHNHKEQMAYIATGLYLTGASALFFQKPLTVTDKMAYQCAIISITVILSIAAFEFVRWQIALRSIVADIIAACDLIRLHWLSAFPCNPDLTPIIYAKKGLKIDMPTFLHTKLREIKPSKSIQRLQVLTLGPILFSGFVLVGRLLLVSP